MFSLFNKKQIEQIKELKQEQNKYVNKDTYSLGIYNGLELALSIMENREPQLIIQLEQEEQIEHNTEQKGGRTIISGVRKRSG